MFFSAGKSDKSEIRSAMLERRRIFSGRGSSDNADKVIVENIITMTATTIAATDSHEVIGGYISFRHEPDITPALTTLEGMGADICLPLIIDKNKPLAFHRWKSGDELQLNEFGIAEPLRNTPELLPDLILLPLLAFDCRGMRIGYGGGYYDRSLRQLRDINPLLQSVGIAYDFQRLDLLPAAAHDVALDVVITEKAIYDFRGLRQRV